MASPRTVLPAERMSRLWPPLEGASSWTLRTALLTSGSVLGVDPGWL
jgi:hypothetical protein